MNLTMLSILMSNINFFYKKFYLVISLNIVVKKV